jgi:hypothetical protein
MRRFAGCCCYAGAGRCDTRREALGGGGKGVALRAGLRPAPLTAGFSCPGDGAVLGPEEEVVSAGGPQCMDREHGESVALFLPAQTDMPLPGHCFS